MASNILDGERFFPLADLSRVVCRHRARCFRMLGYFSGQLIYASCEFERFLKSEEAGSRSGRLLFL